MGYVAQSSLPWHARLGHPGATVLDCLRSTFIPGCPKENPSSICHACQVGKHHKFPFSRSVSTTSAPFDIIHSDVWTFLIPSREGFKYYLLFLDDFSHFLWAIPLKFKSQVFEYFVHLHTLAKTQFNISIKSFQCDNGREFDNQQLHNIFASNGIQF